MPLPLSPLSQEGLATFESSSQEAEDNSPLSTLSHQPSFETDNAHYDVKYSWSGGESTIDDGHEATFTINTKHESDDDVIHELSYGTTPRAGSTTKSSRRLMHNATPKAGSANSNNMHYEETPKAGTSSKGKLSVSATNAVGSEYEGDNHQLSTPSWDIEKTFSFRKKQQQSSDNVYPKKETTKDQQLQHPYHNNNQSESDHRSQSSLSGIWDKMYASIGLSRSESIVDNSSNHGHVAVDGDNMNDERMNESPLSEARENEVFALEVGLMFSADEGDTINDPSTLYSQTLSASYTIESDNMSVQHSPAYDLTKYLKYCREKANPQNNHDDDNDDGGTSVYTSGQSTVRDDMGNRVPENCKMIMGYTDAKRRMTQGTATNETAAVFPTVQNNKAADATTAVPPEEMERRLRELAGQISNDWRDENHQPPALARRLRDFQFAREKRRMKYGTVKLWGILGLYDHLSGVKLDVEWAEDAAWRRKNKQPYLKWSDYEAMKNDGFNRPFFTFLIVSACTGTNFDLLGTAMMFTSIYLNDWAFEPLSINPMIGPSAETLLRLGAKDSYLIVVQSEIYRLASPMVLHAGLIHYFLNMFALWFVGKAIEQIHGFFPAVVQFVVPAIGGTILSAIFLPEYITVGASGGIFGLIGGCIADIIMNWSLLFNEFVNERGTRLSHAKVLIVLLLDIILNCLIGLTPFVDNFTHLGGMIYGFLCGLSTIQLVSPRFFGDERQCFHKFKLLSFRSIGLLVCMAGIVASSFVLFSGDGETNPCTTCTYMSCMTFPPWKEKDEKWWYCDDCSNASAEGTLDTATGDFVELKISCPSGDTAIVGVDDSWPQDEVGLEEMLPTLCREHC